MRTFCAWCGQREKVGGRWGPVRVPLPAKGEPVSHGMCPACEVAFEADVKENPMTYNVFAIGPKGKWHVEGWQRSRGQAQDMAGDVNKRVGWGAIIEANDGYGVYTKRAQTAMDAMERGAGTEYGRANPAVPHGTFAKLRRQAVRRGASDPDAYAAAIERRMMGKNSQHQLSETANLAACINDLQAIQEIVAPTRSPEGKEIGERLGRVIPTLLELLGQAARGIHRNPTLAILGNPRRKLARKVLAIDYVHASDGKKYTHDFAEDTDHGPVCAYVEDGGKRVVLEASDHRAIVKDY